ERRRRFADELDLRADVAPETVRGKPDFVDRRTPRRLGIEVVLEHGRVELLQQRGERRLQIRDLDAAVAAAAEEFDEERDAGAVAVLDAGRVDDQRLRSGIVSSAPRAGPQLRQ